MGDLKIVRKVMGEEKERKRKINQEFKEPAYQGKRLEAWSPLARSSATWLQQPASPNNDTRSTKSQTFRQKTNTPYTKFNLPFAIVLFEETRIDFSI